MDARSALAGHERLDAVEIDILEVLAGDFRYDWHTAEVAWLKERIHRRIAAEYLSTLRGLREKVLHEAGCRARLFRSLTAGTPTLFHEPAFYRAFRETVVPWLRTYPFIRLWYVGCGTGEGVYSMAVLLEEAGLYDRCRIYATDPDESLLQQARDGIFPLPVMQDGARNYLEAGGEHDFSRYYTADYDRAVFRGALKKNLVFAQHDLETDGTFNEFHVIVCRDLLTALAPAIQDRARRLFRDSLVRLGFLYVGSQESVAAIVATGDYEANEPFDGIFRRRR